MPGQRWRRRIGRTRGSRLALTLPVGLLVGLLVAHPWAAAPAGAGPSEPAAEGTGVGGVLVSRDVAFARVGDTSLTLDAYQPADGRRDRPAVVLVHGGGWFQGRAGDMAREAGLLAHQGWVAFSINYRLAAPGRPAWPQALDDVRSAIWWVGANADRFGVDRDRLAVVGASAGGHLAALVATRGIGPGPGDGTVLVTAGAASRPDADADAATPRVRVVAAWSPPVDLAALAPVDGTGPAGCGDDALCRAFWGPEYWGTGPVPLFLGCGPQECPATYREASPAQLVDHGTLPTWMANSEHEIVPLSQVRRMDEALAAAGVPHELVVLPGDVHPYGYTPEVWNRMVPFLAAHLRVPAPAPIDFDGTEETSRDPLLLVLVSGLALGTAVLALAGGLKFRWSGR